MFKEEINQYIPIDGKKVGPIFGTKNLYEFTMGAILIDDQWYALVEDADPSRLGDIGETIKDEYDATMSGWCVLKHYQDKVGKIIPSSSVVNLEKFIEYTNSSHTYWLLAIQPTIKSRLPHKAIDE